MPPKKKARNYRTNKKTAKLRKRQVRRDETPELQNQRQRLNREHKQQVRSEETPELNEKRKKLNREHMLQVRSEETPAETACRKQRDTAIAKMKRQLLNDKPVSIEMATNNFRISAKEMPEFVCTCCHRLLFKQSVVEFKQEKYNLDYQVVSDALQQRYRKLSSDGIVYTCCTCNQALKRPRIPSQAVANRPELQEIPDTLNGLNDLERRLISLRIPFMKMLSLPRGGQKAVKGPAVNIPTKTDAITTLLPRIPDNASILPVKLKRKLEYSGHYMHHTVRPQKILEALHWLKLNNEHYKDIEINLNWEKTWFEQEEDLWNALNTDT